MSDPVPEIETMESDSYRVIYEEARNAVDRQAAEVDLLRAAAGRASGLGAVAVSVLGGIRSLDSGLGAWAWPLGGLLIAAVVLVGLIWRPRDGWQFDPDASVAITMMLEPLDEDGRPLTLAEVYRERALHLGQNFAVNQGLLSRVQSLYTGLLVVEAILVVVLVASIM